ncbi:transcription antitermination factor NusB [Luteolibacter ambystomatis]|uniref:Transcription antitermination protein NusB n=1 Tax=Luteolibacter ambystomatis TaxID=2824561 RepID=A0A975J2H3_9BACT|nr:transcription antitermination factor NusB [Luteolibacter ambystomatis]QUE52845.1 transcription antitermination factor NusB [Luteolibacter ambystomatis]
MPSRRQIREAVIQFLYCADLEGGADPVALREPFWEFITESDRRNLQVATFRTVSHLAHGRETRLEEFVARKTLADAFLSARPEAERLKLELARIDELEAKWSAAFDQLNRIPREGDDDAVAGKIEFALNALFKIDRDLAASRKRFLLGTEDHPVLRGQLEAVSATVRRLQRISDRLRMVEAPEQFPDQADLAKLRESRSEIAALRSESDKMVDGILRTKEELDERLAQVVENYVPERIDPVDRAVLRLAAYEIYHAGVPHKVVINEAIELAKRFGTTDSGRFVNGVLDRLAKDASPSA